MAQKDELICPRSKRKPEAEVELYRDTPHPGQTPESHACDCACLAACLIVVLKASFCLSAILTWYVLCPEWRHSKKWFLGTPGLSAVCSFIYMAFKIIGSHALFH